MDDESDDETPEEMEQRGSVKARVPRGEGRMARREISPSPIAPSTFDRLVSTRAEKLWGRKAIAAELGLTEDRVATLAERDDTPIYKPGGRYFAQRSELVAWLRTKPAKRRKKAKETT